MGFPPLLNLSTKLSTAALPSQTTKTALTLEFMFQNVAYRPTVYITGGNIQKETDTETEKKYLLSTLLALFPTLLVYLAPESTSCEV